MATFSDWTVVFEDRIVVNQNVKNNEGHPIAYKVGDDSFWNNSKWSNVWAIHYKDNNHDYKDSVEYRDETPHASWTSSGLGDFRSQFVSKWDASHLAQLQANWDADPRTEAEKGARPTSYSSY